MQATSNALLLTPLKPKSVNHLLKNNSYLILSFLKLNGSKVDFQGTFDGKQLTNLSFEGVKRSAMNGATTLCRNFHKNDIFLNRVPLKISLL